VFECGIINPVSKGIFLCPILKKVGINIIPYINTKESPCQFHLKCLTRQGAGNHSTI
jgi:hypothetical protein